MCTKIGVVCISDIKYYAKHYKLKLKDSRSPDGVALFCYSASVSVDPFRLLCSVIRRYARSRSARLWRRRLGGSPDSSIRRPQLVVNTAALLIHQLVSFEYMSYALNQHSLVACFRADDVQESCWYYRAVHGSAPTIFVPVRPCCRYADPLMV
jgi:hypothetical protein